MFITTTQTATQETTTRKKIFAKVRAENHFAGLVEPPPMP
jgi:hypothetical protein